MAKRRRDVCGMPESEPLWQAGRGFVVREGESSAVPLKIRATGFAGHSSTPESGAKDTRSPNASRLPDALKLRKASGVRRVHRRFLTSRREQENHPPSP